MVFTPPPPPPPPKELKRLEKFPNPFPFQVVLEMKYCSEKKNSYIFYKELERMILKELHLFEAVFSI